MRLGLKRIIDAWDHCDDFEETTTKIREIVNWCKENPSLEEDEKAIIREMTNRQIAAAFQAIREDPRND